MPKLELELELELLAAEDVPRIRLATTASLLRFTQTGTCRHFFILLVQPLAGSLTLIVIKLKPRPYISSL